MLSLSLGLVLMPSCDKKDKDSKPAAGSSNTLQAGNENNAGENPDQKPGAEDPSKPKAPQTDPALGIEWVWVEGGKFTMGSPEDEEGRDGDEGPLHEVELSGFWMSKTEVTNAQYNAFMKAAQKDPALWEKVKESGANHPKMKVQFKGARQPVVYVSWEDAKAFCEWMGNGVTLPTEAQWEYACRAGSTGCFCFGNDYNPLQLNEYMWCRYTSTADSTTFTVATKKANTFGLCDMHGNAWEWCHDWYDKEYYKISPAKDPAGPADGAERVLRGGGWGNSPIGCRSADRLYNDPGLRYESFGFRLVAQ